jgi:hypothetical protein
MQEKKDVLWHGTSTNWRKLSPVTLHPLCCTLSTAYATYLTWKNDNPKNAQRFKTAVEECSLPVNLRSTCLLHLGIASELLSKPKSNTSILMAPPRRLPSNGGNLDVPSSFRSCTPRRPPSRAAGLYRPNAAARHRLAVPVLVRARPPCATAHRAMRFKRVAMRWWLVRSMRTYLRVVEQVPAGTLGPSWCIWTEYGYGSRGQKRLEHLVLLPDICC